MLRTVACWCHGLLLGPLPWHRLLWRKDELIDTSTAGGMNICRALRGNNEVCSYLSSSHHGKVRSDTAASLLTLEVLGPAFGNYCARGAEIQPIRQAAVRWDVSVVSFTVSSFLCNCDKLSPNWNGINKGIIALLDKRSLAEECSTYIPCMVLSLYHYCYRNHKSSPAEVCLHSMKTGQTI